MICVFSYMYGLEALHAGSEYHCYPITTDSGPL